ncbi:transposase [Streptomyces sp. NPDC058423]|uniref:transposase n=1 Tax=unclassified Streptomyces TaxID=2593676 RepID=UPI0036508CA0
MPLIEGIHAGSGATYGARRITRALRRKGVVVVRARRGECSEERPPRRASAPGGAARLSPSRTTRLPVLLRRPSARPRVLWPPPSGIRPSFLTSMWTSSPGRARS